MICLHLQDTTNSSDNQHDSTDTSRATFDANTTTLMQGMEEGFDGNIYSYADHLQQYFREIRNLFSNKESVVFRDFGGNDYRL